MYKNNEQEHLTKKDNFTFSNVLTTRSALCQSIISLGRDIINSGVSNKLAKKVKKINTKHRLFQNPTQYKKQMHNII